MTFKPKPLAEQVVVITGASSGIGLATARMAASKGARVVLAARNGDALAAACRDIERDGGRAMAVVADVGRRADVQRIADAAVAAFGGFDTWVNVAGLTIYGSLREVSDEDHTRLLQTNLWGVVFGSLVAAEHFAAGHFAAEHGARRGGTIVNLGSVASDLAFPLQGMYVASKHAVKGFTDALRMELLQGGAPIHVTLVKPASIDTPLPQRARNYLNREPMLPPPVYPPEEVAYAICRAAAHRHREIVVGGGGAAMIALRQALPSLYDRLAPLVSALQKRGAPPSGAADALHAPHGDGAVRGTQPGYVMRTSAFTRAGLHPLTTLGLVAACAGAVALAVRRPVRGGVR